MLSMEGLGAAFNVVHQASGLDIPLSRAGAVSFVSFLDAGTHTMVFTQTDSRGINAEIDLNLFTISGVDGSNGVSRIHAGPGVGGTWTDVTSLAANDNTADGADATNDAMVVTVRASQLSDGYNQVQCTSAAGTVIAIVHSLKVMRKPANLRSSLTA
jgi:hypothetical protein